MQAIFKIYRRSLSYIGIYFILAFFLNSFSVWCQNRTKEDIQAKISTLRETPNFQKDTTYINLVYRLGREYLSYNLDSLLIGANEIIKLSQAIKYTKGEALGYLNKGGYYSGTGQQELAIKCFTKAISKAKKTNALEIILESKSELGNEYAFQDEYAKALQEYLSGIEIAKENNSTSYLSVYYINLSVLYSSQKEYNQTIYFLNKAMKLNKIKGDKRLTGITLSNLAYTYVEIGDIANASIHVDECISIFENLKLHHWLTYAYEIKANIYIEQNQFSNALMWLKKSEGINEKIDQKRYKIELYTLMAQAYFGLNNYELSESYAMKALKLSKEFNSLVNRNDILDILFKIKKITGDLFAALSYLEELKAIADTININNNKKELRILKTNQAFKQEKEQYILINKERRIKHRSYIFIAVLIILSFLTVIIILKKNNKTQSRLNQKLLENTKALEKNQKHLNEVNATKNKLFSIIAHDLRGPINTFKSLFDLFFSSDLTAKEFITFMPQIGKNIDSIAFTLNNLLTWGQTQMNGLVTKPSVTAVKTLVDENIRLLSKQAEEKHIQIIGAISSKVIVWCDRNQIDIVIRNLISNAVKFTPIQGTITISAIDKKEAWELQVKDTGVGMDSKTLSNIFKDKFTSSSYGTMNEKGTGLGLKVCKEMVKNNGGQIWVESVLNQGTSFFFTIPKPPKSDN
ncbi:tetratricopeptide repeat-containing sensor histidine kinase [Algibacter pacificus]|uniref:tetratricopeptide repeat-containing sensor histidine kinase n=1 Tax=Algibacter pacificus TaxID=2599389 RepID=UPI0011CA119E|nr:tetratricopeptide repeat-containing sensor histidine kinase [Algibacter pacificus]